MNYVEARTALDHGNKIKLPEWVGYWYKNTETGAINVITREGNITEQPYINDYINRTDWSITDGSRDFGGVLVALKAGRKVALRHWEPDVFISLQVTDAHSKMTHNYLYATSRFGLVPWNPTQPELLSEKWIIVN